MSKLVEPNASYNGGGLEVPQPTRQSREWQNEVPGNGDPHNITQGCNFSSISLLYIEGSGNESWTLSNVMLVISMKDNITHHINNTTDLTVAWKILWDLYENPSPTQIMCFVKLLCYVSNSIVLISWLLCACIDVVDFIGGPLIGRTYNEVGRLCHKSYGPESGFNHFLPFLCTKIPAQWYGLVGWPCTAMCPHMHMAMPCVHNNFISSRWNRSRITCNLCIAQTIIPNILGARL